MTEPTWQVLAQLGALGPIIWLLYRMLPVLKEVTVAFTRLEDRIAAHCAEQAESLRHHEQQTAARWEEQGRWNAEMLRRTNGTKGSTPATGS